METRAPWAETVYTTAEDLFHLPDDGWRYELVDGRLIRMPPTGWEHGRITMRLLDAVYRYAVGQRWGEVMPPETGFYISAEGEPDTVLAPDLAFVRGNRVPATLDPTFPRLAPDLVAEIASPSQSRPAMRAKAQRWLEAGVHIVWLVFPDDRVIEVWRAGRPVRVVSGEEELSGEEILPGLALPVADLFV